MSKKHWYHVTVVRSTVYKVKATNEDEALGSFADTDEVDSSTDDMSTELCNDADASLYDAQEKE